MRKKVKENWTEKHRNVARKIFLEGGWTQKTLFDIGWSDVSQCQACRMEEGTEKHRLYHCSEWHEIRREIVEAFTQSGSKKRERRRRLSEKHKSWACQQKASRAPLPLTAPCWERLASGEHVFGRWDSDEDMGPSHGMYGSVEAELEVHRTIKRTELTAFLCLVRNVCGPIMVHVDKKSIIDGSRKGEKEGIQALSWRCRPVDKNLERIT